MELLKFKYNDGGRHLYFKSNNVADCVTRAITIVTGKDYKEAYNEIKSIIGYSPRNGIEKNDVKKVMSHFGGRWVALMKIGTGCKYHLAKNEIPMEGKIICNLSGHVTSVIDGVINDTYDCSREGQRCVYGYWSF